MVLIDRKMNDFTHLLSKYAIQYPPTNSVLVVVLFRKFKNIQLSLYKFFMKFIYPAKKSNL
jgi:hypothetical protein